jgi:hypothetical protein
MFLILFWLLACEDECSKEDTASYGRGAPDLSGEATDEHADNQFFYCWCTSTTSADCVLQRLKEPCTSETYSVDLSADPVDRSQIVEMNEADLAALKEVCAGS